MDPRWKPQRTPLEEEDDSDDGSSTTHVEDDPLAVRDLGVLVASSAGTISLVCLVCLAHGLLTA
jgi:hypothetical protein